MINKLNKTYVIGARLDSVSRAALEKIALKERRTVSDLVRLWIVDRLVKEAKTKKANKE